VSASAGAAIAPVRLTKCNGPLADDRRRSSTIEPNREHAKLWGLFQVR
jgi:hypothetical protein